MPKLRFVLFLCLLVLALFPAYSGGAQAPAKPMILPIALPPGPDTWMVGQFYGNTTGAYNYGAEWYSAGQRLHFGIDLFTPCGTPLVAVADGFVHAVDAFSFGSAPHNLILTHPDLGLTTLYGHLLETPTVVAGQPVKQGDVVAISGDPDGVCDSRPHIHLEIRSMDFRTTYNPVTYIDAPWHTLASIGPFSYPMFQQDIENPRQWMSVDDQPDVVFGGVPLNNYNRTWPYSIDVRPPDNVTLGRDLGELPASSRWELRQLGFDGCCPQPWWDPLDNNLLYVVDGVSGQRASVFEYTADASQPPTPIYEAPPWLVSPDGRYRVTRVDGQVTIRNLEDESQWSVQTQGALPAVSTDNSRLLWEVWRGQYIPGEPYQTVETWVSDIDGGNARMIWMQLGGWSVWLDDARVLIVTPILDQTDTTLTVFDTRDDSAYTLGSWDWFRGLSVAPGGGRLMFYVIWQDDPAQNGIYTIETQNGAIAQKLPFFGSWRWRDANSIFYIPYDVGNQNQRHILATYNILTGEDRYLTDSAQQAFTIANGDWAVSPEGNKIIFRNARDMSLWLLEDVGVSQ